MADEYGLIGTLIADKYLIEDQVGSGGFGVVYRARHQIWEQPVAVKCFTALSNAPVALREGLLEGFVQEGRLLSALSSRTAGIVQARDIGTLTSPTGSWLPYMVLEWLEGASLHEYLRRDEGHKRSALEAFQILDGAARALGLAHAHRVAHRDIKPDNFFVCDSKLAPGVVVKVLDFGIAKVMQSQAGTAMASTGTQISSFTPNYGAPEQFDRVHGATGPWTDVFGLALVVLEVMSGGTSALSGTEFLQLAFASQNPERRPTPRALDLDVSDAVEAVFAKALAVKVVDRYRNVGEFWAALAEALELRDYPPMPEADGPLQPSEGGGGTRIRGESSVVVPGQPRANNPATVAYGATVRGGRGAVVTADTVPSLPEVMDPPKEAGVWLALGGLFVLAAVGGVAYFVFLSTDAHTNSLPVARDTTAIVEQEPEPEPDVAPTPPEFVAKPTCPEGMVEIAGGKFYMGTDDRDEPSLALANPSHQVEVATFCLDKTEVTLGAYRRCSATGECKRAFRESEWAPTDRSDKYRREAKAYSELCNENFDDRDEHPVNCVTWVQADAYCKQQGYRLPTEAEWEFAARGSDGRTFPWGDEPADTSRGNLCGKECEQWRVAHKLDKDVMFYDETDEFPGTAPVAHYPQGATASGLMDMVGNVFEWTADPFRTYPEPGQNDDSKHMIRGGGFNSTKSTHANPALRFPMDNSAHTHGIGFRCAAALPRPKDTPTAP